MSGRIIFDGELSNDFVRDDDLVFVSGHGGNYRTLMRSDIHTVLVDGNDDVSTTDHVSIVIDRDKETEKRIDDFNAMLRRESDERERRRRNGFDAAAVATLAAAMSVSSHRGQEVYRWRQKSIYKPTEPDHEAHMSAAEIKRKRKAEKLQKIADKARGKGA